MHALQGGSVTAEFVLANLQLNEYKVTVFCNGNIAVNLWMVGVAQ